MKDLSEEQIGIMKKRSNWLLTALTGSASLVEAWWTSPNKAFDMQEPIVVWETEPEKVYSYLMMYHSK